MFLREDDRDRGIIRHMRFGDGPVEEFLPTELPQVSNRRADLIARTADGWIRHVELQATHQADFALRMLEYYTFLVRTYGSQVIQTVLYIGKEPMRLENRFATAAIDFRFEIVNLREWDAEPLLASADWTDNVLALLAKGSPLRALDVLIPKIAAMHGSERDQAGATLVLLSGILEMEEAIKARLKESGMIDVMQNKVLGPMMVQQYHQGRMTVLRELLAEKFGNLPMWAEKRLLKASDEDVDVWIKRILTAHSIEELLKS